MLPPVVQISAATNRGIVRATNEDAVLVDNWIGAGESTSTVQEVALGQESLLLAIADGLGGHRGGHIASELLVRELARVGASKLEEQAQIEEACFAIDDEIRRQTTFDPTLKGMGSTLVAATLSKFGILVFNVGDSRAYIFEKGSLVQLTIDDVPPNALKSVRQQGFRRNHIVTQAFGGSLLGAHLAPHVSRTELPETGGLVLCSDGLTDMVAESTLVQLLGSPEVLAADLVDAAIKAGGADNISVIVVRVKRPE